MPTYEYRCAKNHIIEISQSIHEKPVQKCPKCGAECKRLLFPVGFRLEGSGWAKDGYSSVGEKPKKKKDKKE
jgi:putative FmdB family regulatory protein